MTYRSEAARAKYGMNLQIATTNATMNVKHEQNRNMKRARECLPRENKMIMLIKAVNV